MYNALVFTAVVVNKDLNRLYTELISFLQPTVYVICCRYHISIIGSHNNTNWQSVPNSVLHDQAQTKHKEHSGQGCFIDRTRRGCASLRTKRPLS